MSSGVAPTTRSSRSRRRWPPTVTATAPPDANVAPARYCPLFVVNSDGVSSVAPWVHLG
ncbi:MAG: galactose oxidase-like domain-containing protein [Actinomycetes bacterium]